MQQFTSVNDVLDFAIGKEQEAFELYFGLSQRMGTEDMRRVFKEFAAEEQHHKAKLEQVKGGGQLLSVSEKIADLKIGDYLVVAEPSDEMTYQQALILAMKAEKAAYKLYNDLAGRAPTAELAELFASLANEEAKHKLRFEVEYDEHILTEN
jgi:rubrerythrin